MQTPGIFTIYRFEIPYTKYNEPIYLIPFGDIHRSSPMCDITRWADFLDWAKSKKRAYFLGMGDYDDLGSTSEREILNNAKLHDSTKITLEQLYMKHVKTLTKELAFTQGRLIGLLDGNHYGLFSDGTTTTQRMCQLLECKYLGANAFIRLAFVNKPLRANNTVDVWAHHGKGSARLTGGSLNRVEQMLETAEADICLMGHDHRKSVALKSRLKLQGSGDSLRLSRRKILIGRTGSFLRGYEPDEASYVVDACLNPTELGVIKIELTPRRETRSGVNHVDIDIHGSV
jgi:hypothetical protein